MEPALIQSPLTVTQILNDGRFKRGSIPWIKGKQGVIKNPMKGNKMPDAWKAKLRKPKSVKHVKTVEHIEKLAAKARLRVGSLSSRWKGGNRAVQGTRRRERLAKNGGAHTQGEWDILKARCNWSCVNPECKEQEPSVKLTRDHIVSVKNGGSDNIENIQPLCMKCNVKKHSKSIRYA